MRASRIIAWIALAVLAVVGLRATAATTSSEDDFRIIVHPGSPLVSIDRDLVRDAFLKKTTAWGHGPAMRPIDLPRSPTRDRFVAVVLRKSKAQLRSYWNQQIFSGKGVQPPEASSVDAAIAFVVAHPGAIGYLPADVDPAGARVLRLR